MPGDQDSHLFPRDQQRLQAARDAAIQSFRNRYGRIPTEADVEQLIDGFLPPDLRALRPQRAWLRSQEPSRSGATYFERQRVPEPWEVDAVTRAYLSQLGRAPTSDELDRELGLSRDSRNSFLQRVPPTRKPPPPGFFDRYLVPLFRLLTPKPSLPVPGQGFSSSRRG